MSKRVSKEDEDFDKIIGFFGLVIFLVITFPAWVESNETRMGEQNGIIIGEQIGKQNGIIIGKEQAWSSILPLVGFGITAFVIIAGACCYSNRKKMSQIQTQTQALFVLQGELKEAKNVLSDLQRCAARQ